MSEQLYWLRDNNANWQKVPKNVYDAEMEIRKNYKDNQSNFASSFSDDVRTVVKVYAAPVTIPLKILGGIIGLVGLACEGDSKSKADDDDELTYEKAPVQYSEEQKNSIFLSVAVVSIVLLFLIAFVIYTLSKDDIAGRPTFDVVEVVFLVGPLIGVIGFFGVYFAYKKLKNIWESKDYEIVSGWGLRLLWFVSFLFISIASLVWMLA
jgi:hypothetical protein